MTITVHTEGAIAISSRTGALKIETTVASSAYTKVVASRGSFQDVCGELTRVVQDRPAQSPPFIANQLGGAFRISIIIQETKIAGEKSKLTKISVQQTTDG